MCPQIKICLSRFSLCFSPFTLICCFWSSSTEKQQLVRFSLLVQQWYQSEGFVKDLVCGENHLYLFVFPPSAYVVFQRTRRTKVISSTCLCSNSFSSNFWGKSTFERIFILNLETERIFFFCLLT